MIDFNKFENTVKPIYGIVNSRRDSNPNNRESLNVIMNSVYETIYSDKPISKKASLIEAASMNLSTFLKPEEKTKCTALFLKGINELIKDSSSRKTTKKLKKYKESYRGVFK